MRETLRALLETFAYFLLPPIYAMFVILLAAYFNMLYNVAGSITIIGAIAPVVMVWIVILHKREVRNVEAQIQGFKTSPEKQARVLNEYLNLLDKKRDEKTDN